MPTRSQHRVLALSLMGLASVVLANCGGGSTPTSPGETSFLTGTWNGTLTISRTGQPDVTGPATWTFELVPQTGRHNFNTHHSFSERVDSGHDNINHRSDAHGGSTRANRRDRTLQLAAWVYG